MGQVSFPIVFAQFTFFKIHFVLLINEKKILLLSLNDPFEGRGRVGWVTYVLHMMQGLFVPLSFISSALSIPKSLQDLNKAFFKLIEL